MTIYAHESELKSQMIHALHRWWMNRSGADIPDRRDFDPADFKKLLPNILITDIEHAPFRVRYRVVGTRVVEATGFNITGRYLDELMPTEPEAPWLDLYQRCCENRKPMIGTSTCTTTSGGLFTHEFGLFPLRKNGMTVDQVLSIEDYDHLTSTLTDLVQWRERDTGSELSKTYSLGATLVPGVNPLGTTRRQSV
jgi:hypothetical protein